MIVALRMKIFTHGSGRGATVLKIEAVPAIINPMLIGQKLY